MNSLEQRDEAIWMCPIPVRMSRIQELVDEYPSVQERIDDFFESESFKEMFAGLMNFIYTQRVWLNLSKEEIEEYAKKNVEHPELREAHKALAREIITFLHGKEEYERAEKLAQSLFNNEFKNLTKQDISDLFDEQDIKDVESNISLVDMLVKVGAASSKREAREFTQSGAVSINGEKITDVATMINDNMFIDNTYIIIKRGKKNYYIGRK